MLRRFRKDSLRSAMKLDPAVIKLLNLDPDNTSVSSAGGGGCSSASTSKITSKLSDSTEKLYFMKTGRGKDAEIMFEGIHSLLPLLWVELTLITNARRTCISQCDPLSRAHPLPTIFRPWSIHISTLHILPRNRLFEPHIPFLLKIFRAISCFQTRKTTHHACADTRWI